VQVLAQMKGEQPLPWEAGASGGGQERLGALSAPLLQLLHRDALHRPSIDMFRTTCSMLLRASGPGDNA
jgi:hypothetical protein